MKAKSSGLISIIYGFVGCGFGVFALLMIFMGQKMIRNFESTDQIDKMRIYFAALQQVWLIYMPLMIIIGLIYVLSGVLLKEDKKGGISAGIFAGILNLLWFAGYAISVNNNVMPVFPHKLEPALQIFAISIAGIFICLYPLYFLFTFKRIQLDKN